MRKLIKNEKANFLLSIVTVISVMFAVIIGAIVFFAFADTTSETAVRHTDIRAAGTYVYTNNVGVNITRTPSSTPGFIVTVAGDNPRTLNSTDYSYVSSNTTVVITTTFITDGDTAITATYNSRAYDSVTSVITYAMIVFAMAALVPLIIIGGVMLNSLGYFGGGKGGKP